MEINQLKDLLRPSSASRIVACPGSVKLSIGQPKAPSSAAAQRGTDHHKVLENLIHQRNKGDLKHGVPFDKLNVVADHFYLYELLEWFLHPSRFEDAPLLPGKHKLVAEQRFYRPWSDFCDLEEVQELKFGGTSDLVLSWIAPPQEGALNQEKSVYLEIGDLKTGNYPVYAEDNTQLMLYAFFKAHELAKLPSIVRLTILQEGNCNSATYTGQEVDEKGKAIITDIIEAIKFAKSTEAAPLNTGAHCAFCPAKLVCPARQQRADHAVSIIRKAKEPRHLSDAQLETLVAYKKEFETFLKEAKVEALERFKVDNSRFSKLKLVRTISRRKISKEAELLRDHGEKVLTKKLKTLKELDKLIGKEGMKQYTSKSEGALEVVGQDDRRKAVELTNVSDIFEKIEG